jgi:hypothetical protein
MQQYRARGVLISDYLIAVLPLSFSPHEIGLFAQRRRRRQNAHTGECRIKKFRSALSVVIMISKSGRQTMGLAVDHSHTHTQCNENSRAQIAAMQSCALRLNNNCSLCVWEKIAAAPNFIHRAHITTDRVARIIGS